MAPTLQWVLKVMQATSMAIDHTGSGQIKGGSMPAHRPWRRLLAVRLFAVCLLAVCALAVRAAPAAAHEVRPAIVDLVLDPGGVLMVVVRGNLEAMLAGIGPQHGDTSQAPQAPEYDRLRRLPPVELRAAFDARSADLLAGIGLRSDGRPVPLSLTGVAIPEVGDLQLARNSAIRLTGRTPQGARTLVWHYARSLGDSVVRVIEAGEERPRFSAYVAGGAASEPIPLRQATPQGLAGVFADYVTVGFRHIVPDGLDHILFVVGLFLLNVRPAPLLAQVTGFTVAHSVTLALGALGLVRISPGIVEPLIAASIVYVAVENMLTDRLQRWRPVVVFGFGLLHGLGFASALGRFGLPDGQFLPGLVGFNLGVELGQLVVIAACYLAVGLWFGRRSWYRRVVVLPASAAIAAVAAFWFLERVGAIA